MSENYSPRRVFKTWQSLRPASKSGAPMLDDLTMFMQDNEDSAKFWAENGHEDKRALFQERADWAWREIRDYNDDDEAL